jgi:DNA mismatch repair protein MutL
VTGLARRIRILPEIVQNKIAAGEVVESPASVVKELVENAVDAGAANVAVEIEEGGSRLIRVSDDGCGMDEEDLVLSLDRHATSKISEVEDIFAVSTLGFRGEALPSIASVSRMTLASAAGGEGRELVVEAGERKRLSPAAPRKGTLIEVRDIFFNTPARRKFLRGPGAENARIVTVLTRTALAHPEVGFRLQIDGRISLAVHPAAGFERRILDLFGKGKGGRWLPFAHDIAPGAAVEGYLAAPPENRHNSAGINLFVNRRWFSDARMAYSIREAAHGAVMTGKYPAGAFYITVDPGRVDVNVHPAKREVRFDNAELIARGLRHGVRAALAEFASAPTFRNVSSQPLKAPTPAFPAVPATARLPRKGGLASAPLGDFPGLPQRPNDFSRVDLGAVREAMRGGEKTHSVGAPPAGAKRPDEKPPPPTEAADPPSPSAATAGRAGLPNLGAGGEYRLLGQAGGKYIAVDTPAGLVLIDPHALHERWNFDRLREQRKRGHSTRKLLTPLEIALSPTEAEAAVETAPSLAELGFEVLLPKPDRLVVNAAPSFLAPSDLEQLIRQVLLDMGGMRSALELRRDKLLASLACRSSVLLGKNLPAEEIDSLLDKFYSTGQMPTCPHGRPTAIAITWEELGRLFGR